MTTPTRLLLGPPILPPNLAPTEVVLANQSPPLTTPSPRKIYTSKIQGMQIVNEEGDLKKKYTLRLESLDQEAINTFWKTPQRFKNCDWSWNFYNFFTIFAAYFEQNFKGSSLELRQGLYHVIGQKFWGKVLKEIVETPITEEMWEFSKEPPRCYEFWIRLDPSTLDLNPEKCDLFHRFALYLFAIQKTEKPLTSLHPILAEFESAIQNPTISEEIKHLEDLAQRTSSSLEIPLHSGSSLKFYWTTASLPNSESYLSLYSDEKSLSYEILPSSTLPTTLFYDRIIHRFPLRAPNDPTWEGPKMIGKYWAWLTCGGPLFNHLEVEKKSAQILKKKGPSIIAEAFLEGKKHIPQGPEALAAYYCNTIYFLKAHLKNVATMPQLLLTQEEEKKLSKTPLGSLFVSYYSAQIEDIEFFYTALQLVSSWHVGLKAHNLEIFLTESHLDICWKNSTTVHLVIPIPQTELAPALDLSFISQVLEVFPSLSITANSKNIPSPDALSIYQKMRQDDRFFTAAIHLLWLLSITGQKEIGREDVLILPSWISWAVKTKNLEYFLAVFSKLYGESSWAPLFSEIQDKIRGCDENAYLTALQPLLVCSDLKIFPEAWKLYGKSCPTPSFLIQLAPFLDKSTFPCAIGHLGKFTPSEQAELFEVYFDRLLQFSHDFFATYGKIFLETSNRPFLAKLLQKLSKTTKGLPKEIYSLIETVQPKKEEIAELLKIFLSQYPLEPKSKQFDQYIQTIKKQISIFSLYQDKSIIENIKKLIRDLPDEENLWAQFAEMLETLKGNAFFLEDYVVILELLASKNNPPLKCFKNKFIKIESQLTDPQKDRLALAYTKIVIYAANKKQETAIIKALPSLEWLTTRVQTLKFFSAFVNLFLCLTRCQNEINLTQALWITTHLETAREDHDLTTRFIQFLCQQKTSAISSLEWKKTIAKLISELSNPLDKKIILQIFCKLPRKEERWFFDHCWNLHSKQSLTELDLLLKEYHKIGTIPIQDTSESLTDAIKQEALEQLLQSGRIKEALTLLSSAEDNLWALVFQALDHCNDATLIEMTWDKWIKQQAARPFKSGHEKWWRLAIKTCFTDAPPRTSSILTTQLLELQKKVGDFWAYLSHEIEVDLALLMCGQGNLALKKAGHERFLSIIQRTGPKDLTLFKKYCSKPYLAPSDPAQLRFNTWIDGNWSLHKDTLGWEEACNLIQTLCNLKFKSSSTDTFVTVVFSPHIAYEKWKDLATSRTHSSIQPEIFLETSCSVVDAIIGSDKNIDSIVMFLPVVSHHFFQFVQAQPLWDLQILQEFQLFFSSRIFEETALRPSFVHAELLNLALIHLNTAWPYLQKIFPLKAKTIAAFVKALPQILHVPSTDPLFLNRARQILENMMKTDSIVEAVDTEDYSWSHTLRLLCAEMQGPLKKTTLEPFVMQIFLKCIHQDPDAPLPESLLEKSTPIFAQCFLTQPLETLTKVDFDLLIKGLSETQIEVCFRHLGVQQNATPPTHFLYQLAKTLIFKYIHPKQIPISLPFAIPAIMPFDSQLPSRVQILTRGQWIIAFKKILSHPIEESYKQKYEALKIQRDTLSQELIKLAFADMDDDEKYQTYSKLFLEILGDDREIAEILFAGFQIPTHLPPLIITKLNLLKTIIQRKLQ